MARMTEGQLQRRGRLAYELGRFAWASHILLLVLPVLLAAHLLERPAALVLGVGAMLAVLGFGLAMLHDRYARAVMAGVLSAVPALAIPVLVRSLGMVQLGNAALDPCVPAAFIAGIVSGAFVSARAVDEKHRVSYWLAAIAAAALTGVLGCSVVGDVGVLGLLAGLFAGTVPILVRRGLRRG